MNVTFRNVCGVAVLGLAIAVFVLSILLGYMVNVEFMVFAFPLFITTLMCGVKCMEPCNETEEDEGEEERGLLDHRPNNYGTTSHVLPNEHESDSDPESPEHQHQHDSLQAWLQARKVVRHAPDDHHHHDAAAAAAHTELHHAAESSPGASHGSDCHNNNNNNKKAADGDEDDGNKQEGALADFEDDGMDPELCIVCLDEPRQTVFSRCGHMCLCVKCARRMRRCPICQKKGTAIKVYLV